MADPVLDKKSVLSANAEQADAKTKEAFTAAVRNIAQRDLAEAKTAQTCVSTAIQARDNQLQVTLPKVCDKYVQKTRQDQK